MFLPPRKAPLLESFWLCLGGYAPLSIPLIRMTSFVRFEKNDQSFLNRLLVCDRQDSHRPPDILFLEQSWPNPWSLKNFHPFLSSHCRSPPRQLIFPGGSFLFRRAGEFLHCPFSNNRPSPRPITAFPSRMCSEAADEHRFSLRQQRVLVVLFFLDWIIHSFE